MSNKTIALINYKDITRYLQYVNHVIGLKPTSSKYLIKSIVGSSLRGVDSHGLRLFAHYVKAISGGRINKNPKFVFKTKNLGVGILDADNGLGHEACYIAVHHVTKIAKKNGIGVVGIINSSHNGAAGAYNLEIAEDDCIGFSFTHSDALSIPFNGLKKFHGTNPFSFCAPLKKNKKLLVDFASTSIPWNKVLRARNNKINLSKNLAFDLNGKMTINPNKADSLAPLGGDFFGHKGFGLSSSIEVLCGPLIGMLHGFKLLPMSGPNFNKYRKLGQLLIAIKINSFQSKKKYFNRIENYIKDLKKQKSKKRKKIFYPGELEFLEEKKRRKEGIPFDNEMINDFLDIDKKFKVFKFKKLISK